jgi:hypothetical protein
VLFLLGQLPSGSILLALTGGTQRMLRALVPVFPGVLFPQGIVVIEHHKHLLPSACGQR